MEPARDPEQERRHDSDELAWLEGTTSPRASEGPGPAAPAPIADDESCPTIRRVDELLQEVVRSGASALHLEPDAEGGLRVRLRIDGVFHEAAFPRIPAGPAGSYLARLKIIAKLDISERRLPQSGELVLTCFEPGPLRFAAETIPGARREMFVLRRLDPPLGPGTLDALGLEPDDLERVRAALRGAAGLVLVAGPRHAGKRTFLEASLRELVSPEQCLMTIGAAPREIQGVVAVPLREASGFTRAWALKAALAKSPDAVAIDDLRELEETALAFDGAVAGSRVIATLAAPSTAHAVQRLLDLGVGPFALAHGLALVVAPRLLRRLCEECKAVGAAPDRAELGRLAPRLVARGALRDWRSAPRAVGCDACHGTGYRGLLPVFEVLVPDESLRSALIAATGASGALEAVRERTTSLCEAALLQAYEGATSVAEALRATR